MKILAPAIPRLENIDQPARMVKALMAYFRETDPTSTLRLISLLYHEPVETLVETFTSDQGMDAFMMISYGFAANSIGDLMEATRVLGFRKDVKEVADG